MYLKDILKRENNNFDLLRIIAAFLVIYGHSNVFVPQNKHVSDFVARFIHFDYSGGVAVKVFFFLSGLVVTNSLLSKRNSLDFVLSRVFRILPALICVLFITTFFIGAIFTQLSLSEYFHNSETYSYFYNNIIMNVKFNLPGVFVSHSNSAMNGSLWSIPYEVFSYAFLFCLFVFGIFKNRIIATIVGLLIILDAFMGNKFIFTWIQPDDIDVQFLSLSFITGCLLALWKDEIKINIILVLASWILIYIFRNTSITPYAMYFSLFISLTYLFSLKPVLRIKIKHDISYGVYLWGWPIQQVWISISPNIGSMTLTLRSFITCLILGYLSWILIEKPFMRYGKNISLYLDNRS